MDTLQLVVNKLGAKFADAKEVKEGHVVELMHAVAINLGPDGVRICRTKTKLARKNYCEELSRLIASDVADAIRIVGVYLDAHPSLVRIAIDGEGNNALHIAARHGKHDMAMFLLERGVNSKAENGAV